MTQLRIILPILTAIVLISACKGVDHKSNTSDAIVSTDIKDLKNYIKS